MYTYIHIHIYIYIHMHTALLRTTAHSCMTELRAVEPSVQKPKQAGYNVVYIYIYI